jgi:hypothetical protein
MGEPVSEPLPEGATWVVRDPDGRIVEYSTEPIRLEMTTELGESLGLSQGTADGSD